jgi:hypothetical protein
MGWQEATAETTKRLREVLALAPAMSHRDLVAFYAEARAVALSVAGHDSTRYWNTFINTLRIFFAAMGQGDVSPEALFPVAKAQHQEARERCPRYKRVGSRKVQCDFVSGHTSKCEFGGL